MQVILANWRQLASGLQVTLEMSLLSILFGTMLGVLIGVGLLYGPLPIRLVLRAYVDILRGTPLLVVIFLLFYGLPAVGVEIDGFWAAVAAFSLFAGAHIAEIVRGAVRAVPRGQWDAARAIGLTFVPALRWIILPQAIPAAVPPWTNTAVELVKASSLAYLVSVPDLLFKTQNVLERTGVAMPLYIAAALTYFVVNLGVSRFGHWLERRFRYAA